MSAITRIFAEKNKISSSCHRQTLEAESLRKCKVHVTYSMLTEMKYPFMSSL